MGHPVEYVSQTDIDLIPAQLTAISSELKTLEFETLKGSVCKKNERGYRLTAKNKRFWSLLILFLFVASIRRKLLKTTYTEERIIYKNSEYTIRIVKNQFNFKNIILRLNWIYTWQRHLTTRPSRLYIKQITNIMKY